MKQKKNNVAIIGGCIVGSLLALILGLNGLKITVIDRQKKDKLFSKNHYVKSYALNQGSSNLLNILNIWDIIKTKSQPIEKILLKQGSSISSIQPFELKFTADLKTNDHIFFMIEEIYLKKAIIEKIYTGSEVDNRDGFIHLSTKKQLEETVAKHF